MKILVIGGTGYIGCHTVNELVRRGHQVTVFARGRIRTPLPESVRFIKGDRHRAEDLERARDERFDAVIDIIAYTRDETQMAIKVFDGHIGRYVHLSSMAVYQLTPGKPLVEDDPLVTDPANYYAYNKAECERALRWAYTKNQFPFVSLRPAVVFGPGDDKSRENYYLKRILAGDPIIVPGSGTAPIFAVYVLDLAAAIAQAVSAGGIDGSAYHLCQPELISLNEHIRVVARLAEEEADIEHIPPGLLERLGFNLMHFPYYAGDALIYADTTAARRDLGFSPTPYLKAASETVQYFLERGPENLPSIEDQQPPLMPRSRERALVERYRRAIRELEDRLTDEWLNEALPEL